MTIFVFGFGVGMVFMGAMLKWGIPAIVRWVEAKLGTGTSVK